MSDRNGKYTAPDVNFAERLPPNSRESERALLGCMLRENECISDVSLLVRPLHFYHDWGQKIYQAILDIVDRGSFADLVTVSELLNEKKQIADVGGYAFIGELWHAAPTSINALAYARTIADLAHQRFVIHHHAEKLDRAYESTPDVRGLIEDSIKGIQEIADHAETATSCTVSMKKIIDGTVSWIDCRKESPELNGVPTGFIDLDAKIGAFHEGELCLIAARPSVGKTALACQLAVNAAKQGMPVFFVSLEQSWVELGLRWLCCETGLDGNQARKGYVPADKTDAVIYAIDRLRTLPIIVDDTPNQTILRITNQARRLTKKEGIRLVIVDYLQLIEMERGQGWSREQQVANTSRRLKTLARELRVPVIALAQLNRQVEHRGEEKPKLADLRDSGSLEQDADLVMMLWRPEGRESNLVELLVEKQRNGPTGPITLTFLKHCTRFENHAVQSREYNG